MKKEFFRNILVFNSIRKIQFNFMSTSQKTNGNKQQQQLKIDITSDNICRK
jgi:hypothetical protein